MTHGEEPGPETHKDSAVLTYLEGLLMHPVVVGPGATASGRSDAAHNNQEQGNKVGGPYQLPSHGPAAPKTVNNGPTLGSSQHLKKARLLRSGAWNDPGDQRISCPPVERNGQVGSPQNGALEGSPHAGESTLLASLLQSFSSRLQSVAMSQHTNKSSSECSSPSKPPPADNEPLPVYGTASNRLKGLMRKSKLQNHSNTPYSRRAPSQDRHPESPRSIQSTTPPTTPQTAESCSERLKAVANIVKIRSSPAPSPKPSVACSQLALLLSSEAHLQQYSREHALKAQLSGRSASERLAAIANQQQVPENKPPSVLGSLPGTPDVLNSLTTQNGSSTTTTTTTTTLPRTALSSPQSPSVVCGHSQSFPPNLQRAQSHTHTQPQREKRSFDSRPTRPPQTCSSLLLLLLNNHNSQKQLTKNGHLEDNCGVLPPSCSTSVTSDSECSTQERSLTKDSSDAESCYSSCSPIDLSLRSNVNIQNSRPKTSSPPFRSVQKFSSTPQTSTQPSISSLSPPTGVSSVSTAMSTSSSSISTSSLDKLTETLIKKWKPEPSRSKFSHNKEPELSPELKSNPKLTLMQLLLERRNNEMANKIIDNQPLDISLATMSRNQQNGLVPWEETRTKSPADNSVAPAQPLHSLSHEPSDALSPYSYPSPNVQSSPLDLCKSKTFPAEKASESTFSASKLLQNLAQCGTTSSSSSSSPIPSGKPLSQDVEASRPLALLERLNAPVHRTATSTPVSDGASGCGTPSNQKDASPPTSQIENLLERRTVLQLLLGSNSTATTASRRDRRSAEGAGGGYERSSSAALICDSSKGPSLDVKVKSEVEEAGPSSAMLQDLSGNKRVSGYERNNLPKDAQDDLKTEPRPAEVIAKYGLLSQLLKQQTATYYTSAAVQTESQPRPVKEEQRDYPSPKKRRLCSDRSDCLNNISSPRALDGGDSNIHASPAAQVEYEQQKSVKEDKAPSETLSRESRGFNVLKQLLLSDNGLKKLSQQPRGAASPSVLQPHGKANGSILSPPAHSHNFLHMHSWNPHGSLNSGLPNTLRPLPTPPTADSPIRSPWSYQSPSWPSSQKQDTPPVVKQEPNNITQWISPENEELEDEDSNPDSPRLSRSNPILYYMLQKGSLQLNKDGRSQAEGASSIVKVKEEPMSDMHAYDHRLAPTLQSSPHNDKHSHESRGLSHTFK